MSQMAELIDRLKAVEAEIEIELAKRREELRFRIEQSRIVFDRQAARIHRALKTHALRYLLQSNPLIALTAPVIYALIVPVAVLDLCTMAYQAICFPAYGTRRCDAGTISCSTGTISPISI